MDLFFGVLPFVRVAEERGFRAAAAQLGVSTAAVSKTIAKLEAQLGVTLFERSSRSVALTAEGTRFLQRCQVAITELRAGYDRAAEIEREPHGTLRVTLPPPLGRVMTAVVTRLSALHPRLSIEVIVTNRVLPLAEREIDVALRMGPLKSSALVRRLVLRSRWVTLASPAYLRRRGVPSSPNELTGHECLKFVLHNKIVEWSFRETAAGSGEAAVVPTSSRLLFDQGDLLVEAAIQGVGIAQVFDFMAAPFLQSGALVSILEDFETPGPAVHALMSRRKRALPRVRAFLDALQSAIPSVGAAHGRANSRLSDLR